MAILLLGALAIGVWQAAIHWAPSRVAYPQQGIDVSHHQGDIDWPLVASQGVGFAYIKASEGADHRDTRFEANWNGAADAGIARGAYHFFTLCKAGAAQAANFIAAVPKTPDALPPAVDLEFGGNCDARPAPATLIAELRAFLDAVEAHYRQPVTLYLTREFDAGYEVSAKIDRPLWLRQLGWEPRWGARPWAIWQASSFRNLDGINGRVDWNVMSSGSAELNVRHRPPPPPDHP